MSWNDTSIGGSQSDVRSAVICPVPPTSTTNTKVILNAAYTYGSAGIGYAATFQAGESANLTDFYVRVNTQSGAWGDSTDGQILVEIRDGLNGTRKAGTNLVSSFYITIPVVTDQWIKKTGLSIALTAGKVYSVCIVDDDAIAGEYATMYGTYGTSTTQFVGLASCYTTADGFATTGADLAEAPAIAFKVGSIWYGGTSMDYRNTITSSTLKRGVKFTPASNVTLVGWMIGTDVGAMWSGNATFELYSGSQVPNDTPLLSHTPPTTTLSSGTAPLPSGYMLPRASWQNLTGGSTYRLTVDHSSAATTPREIRMATGGDLDANLATAMLALNGSMIYTIEVSGGASWTDSSYATMEFAPILIPTQAAGGAGGSYTFIS